MRRESELFDNFEALMGMLIFIMLGLSSCVYAIEAACTGFNAPTGLASGPDGSLYISNWGGGTVDRISANGTRTIFSNAIASPAGIVVDTSASVYIASYSGDYITRIDPDGTHTRIAENLATPTGLSFSADGHLLVANRASGEVLSLNLQTGEKRVLADSFSLPVGVVEMPERSLVVSQYGGRVTRVMPDGSRQELGQSFVRPGVGIVADGADAVLVVDNGAGLVRRVTFDGRSSEVSKKLPGSAVALGRDNNGNLLVGTWGTGALYRIEK